MIPIPETTRELIRTLATQGHTNRNIAQQTGVSHRTIRTIRQKAGITPERPRLTQAELQRALELLKDGASYAEAAATIGHSRPHLIEKLPGYSWTHQQAAQYALLRRRHKTLVAAIDAMEIP